VVVPVRSEIRAPEGDDATYCHCTAVTAVSALATASGPFVASTEYYRPIREYITGFAALAAAPAAARV